MSLAPALFYAVRRRREGSLLSRAVAVQTDDGWAWDTTEDATPDGYVVSDEEGGYQIDTTASEGLTLYVRGGRPYIEVTA